MLNLEELNFIGNSVIEKRFYFEFIRNHLKSIKILDNLNLKNPNLINENELIKETNNFLNNSKTMPLLSINTISFNQSETKFSSLFPQE